MFGNDQAVPGPDDFEWRARSGPQLPTPSLYYLAKALQQGSGTALSEEEAKGKSSRKALLDKAKGAFRCRSCFYQWLTTCLWEGLKQKGKADASPLIGPLQLL